MVQHKTLCFECFQKLLDKSITITGAPSVVSPNIFLGSNQNFSTTFKTSWAIFSPVVVDFMLAMSNNFSSTSKSSATLRTKTTN